MIQYLIHDHILLVRQSDGPTNQVTLTVWLPDLYKCGILMVRVTEHAVQIQIPTVAVKQIFSPVAYVDWGSHQKLVRLYLEK